MRWRYTVGILWLVYTAILWWFLRWPLAACMVVAALLVMTYEAIWRELNR